MNEWGLIGQGIFVGVAKSATSFKFKSRRGYVRDGRIALSNPHSSWLDVRSHFMQIATYYSHSDIENKLGELFGLGYSGQDWDIVNANSERISEFISYFLETNDSEELNALFDLIIASIDDLILLCHLRKRSKKFAKVSCLSLIFTPAKIVIQTN